MKQYEHKSNKKFNSTFYSVDKIAMACPIIKIKLTKNLTTFLLGKYHVPYQKHCHVPINKKFTSWSLHIASIKTWYQHNNTQSNKHIQLCFQYFTDTHLITLDHLNFLNADNSQQLSSCTCRYIVKSFNHLHIEPDF
jgi:hypothetical protein